MPVDLSNPSICIPRVFANVNKSDIREVFELVLGVKGCIERIDLLSRTDSSGAPFGRAFIHFRFWPQNDQAKSVREQLLAGEQVKIVYDDPWYWKCGQSRVAKPEFTRVRAPPRVELLPRHTDNPAPEQVEEPLLDSAGLPLLRVHRQAHDDPRFHDNGSSMPDLEAAEGAPESLPVEFGGMNLGDVERASDDELGGGLVMH
jgi:hypothetical protein